MSVIYPVAKHFRFIKGNTFEYSFQYFKGDVPVDLTTYTGKWTITHEANGVSIDTIYDTNAGPDESGVFLGLNQNPTNGFITLVITANDTALIPWRYATYRLELTTGSKTFTLLDGGLGFTTSN